MTDDAVVTFGKDGSFQDTGFMAVTETTLGNNPLHLPGGQEHFYLSYYGQGVQTPTATGATATYTSLHFDFYGYQGPDASFSIAGGTPVVTGAQNPVLLATGELIPGQGNLQITFGPNGAVTSANGVIKETVQVGGQPVGELDINVAHGVSDVGYPPTGGISLTGGQIHATFVPLSSP